MLFVIFLIFLFSIQEYFRTIKILIYIYKQMYLKVRTCMHVCMYIYRGIRYNTLPAQYFLSRNRTIKTMHLRQLFAIRL